MKLSVLEDHINDPLLVYDGLPPNNVFYSLNFASDIKIDLMNVERSNIPDDKIKDIYNILGIKEKKYLGTDYTTFEVTIDDYSASVSYHQFKGESGEKYGIIYSLDEYSPSRFRIHVVAVVQIIK